MKAHYLFEFCDQTWVPRGARECLFEVMESCNSGLRSFNSEVAGAAIRLAGDNHLSTIVELGAGRAPITQELLKHDAPPDLRLVPCDLVPNEEAYRQLAELHPDRVFPVFTPVDLTHPQPLLQRAVLVMAGVMHHIPFSQRRAVIDSLSRTQSQIAVFEPLQRNALSIFLAALSFFPALLLPLTFCLRPGRLRRLLWCWIVPIVPYFFAWDGVASCLRQWTIEEWQAAFAELPEPPDVEYRRGFNSLTMYWSGSSKASAKDRHEERPAA